MVLVGFALLGALALGFSQVIGDALKGQKNVQNAVDFDILKTSINMVLNTKACDGAFKDASGNSVQLVFPASMPVGTNIIAAASPFPIAKILQGNSLIAEKDANLGGGMKISKLEFTDAIYDGDQALGTPAVTYKAFVATLNVEATKAAGFYGDQAPKKTFSVRLLVLPNASNTSGTVERCGTLRASGGGFTRMQVLTSGTSWIVPSGISTVKATMVGGGGGGGGSNGSASPLGAGGGGGATVIKYFTGLSEGSSIPYSIGAGGTVTLPATTATGGGTTTFNGISAPGGAGGASLFYGVGQGFGSLYGASGGDGSASGGDFYMNGQAGGPALYSHGGTSDVRSYPGAGGASLLGIGAEASLGFGRDSWGYGSGGGGATPGLVGGQNGTYVTGRSGVIILEY